MNAVSCSLSNTRDELYVRDELEPSCDTVFNSKFDIFPEELINDNGKIESAKFVITKVLVAPSYWQSKNLNK